MSTPSRSASARASAFGRTLKPTTSAFEVAASMMSPSVIGPTPWWITLTRTSGCSILASSETAASTEPPTSPLRIRFRSWTAPSCSWEKRVSSETPPFERCASCSVRSRWPRRCASVLASRARLRLLPLPAAVVVERAPLAGSVPRHDRVADAKGAPVDEHRGDRAATDVEARLDDRARGLGLRVGGQLELGVGNEQDLLEQVVEVGLLLRGDVGELDV